MQIYYKNSNFARNYILSHIIMKKNLILTIIFLSFSIPLMAEGFNALIMHMKSGIQVTNILEEQPIITFQNDELVITTCMNTISYQQDEVLKFTYASVDPNNISQINISRTMISMHGNTLSVNNTAPFSTVLVFAEDGAMVASAKADENGDMSLNISREKGVVYFIKTSEANFKISLR